MQNNQKNSEITDKNKENKKDYNEEDNNKPIQAFFFPTPVFFNPMLKTSKNFYGNKEKKERRNY